MAYLTYVNGLDEYPVCVLTPTINGGEIRKEYLDPVELDPSQVIVIDSYHKKGTKKTPIKEMREYLTTFLVPILEDQGVQYIVVSDAEYYKELTGQANAAADIGYVRKSTYGNWHVVYVPNYRAVFYDPIKIRTKIKQSMSALKDHALGEYEEPGSEIIKVAHYPKTNVEIEAWLKKLLEMDVPLTVDIEAFSLKAQTSGIGTISFAWNEHEGIAFAVDYAEIPGTTEAPFGRFEINHRVRWLLRDFFERIKQKIIFHNIAYDGGALIFQLFMEHLIDTTGMLTGMAHVLKNWDDTKIISYLATNSCAGNQLSLKEQAQEFAGNYAETDIKDITLIPLGRLLTYNLTDALSTWFTYHKNYPKMVQDDQEQVYQEIFKPATVDIIQMQLTGMPVYMPRVMEVKKELTAIHEKAYLKIQGSILVQEAIHEAKEAWVIDKNAKLKKKRVTIDDAPTEDFNPLSPKQMQNLLYKVAGLPVISFTDTKQPAIDADTLKKLKSHTEEPEVINVLTDLLEFLGVDKIVSTFIPALEGALLGPDGWHYLFGNFNLGGTVSGRLSSSDPKQMGFM